MKSPTLKKLAIFAVLCALFFTTFNFSIFAQEEQPPVIEPVGDKRINISENPTLTFTVRAYSPVNNYPLTYSLSPYEGQPQGAAINSTTGVFTWTPTWSQARPDYPNPGYLPYRVGFLVTDSQGLVSQPQIINIDVVRDNHAPEIELRDTLTGQIIPNGANITMNESEERIVVIKASDPDGDLIHVFVPGQEEGGNKPYFATVNMVQGPEIYYTITFRPDYEAAGQYNNILVLVEECLPSGGYYSSTSPSGCALGLSNSSTFNLTVNNKNRPPELAPIGNKDVKVGQNLTFDVFATDPDLYNTDPQGNTLNYSTGPLPRKASFVARNFSWTPTAEQIGVCPVTFTVKDSENAEDSETINIAVHKGVEVYAFYNPLDTIIYQDNAANYPEVAFLTLVAVETLPDGTLRRYQGPDSVQISVYTKEEELPPARRKDNGYALPYTFLDLTAAGLELSEIEQALFENNSLNWKGFFRALGDADSLRNILNNNIAFFNNHIIPPSFQIDNNKGYTVIAIASWNYKDTCSNLDLRIKKADGSMELSNIQPKELSLKLNVDNVKLIRENVEVYLAQDPDNYIADFRGEPGKFVIARTQAAGSTEERLYDKIIGLKMKEARTEIPYFSVGDSSVSVDWIQVAATDIYNANYDNEVFKSILEVRGQNIPGDEKGKVVDGRVAPEYPMFVFLNPYVKTMRFNGPVEGTSGFFTYASRVGVSMHESLHAHQLCMRDLQQELGITLASYQDIPFYDLDLDELVVLDSRVNTKYKYFTFAWDNKQRGFLNFVNPTNLIKAYISDNPLGWGDSVKHNNLRVAYFVTRIDNKGDENNRAKLTLDEINTVFSGQDIRTGLKADIPFDFPDPVTTVQFYGAYLFDSKTGVAKRVWRSAHLGEELVTLLSPPPEEIRRANGEYQAKKNYYFVKGCNDTLSKRLYQEMFKNNPDCGLYAIFVVSYQLNPYEFDAEMFNIKQGQGYE